MLSSHKDLTVWQKSIDLVSEIYRLTKFFPKEEIYGLSSQMRRAAVSIPANIAEGYARKHRQEYLQFLRIAYGSSVELDTHLIIAKRLSMVPIAEFQKSTDLLSEIAKMLNALHKTLNPKP